MDSQHIQTALQNYVSQSSVVDVSKVKIDTLLFEEGIFDSMAFVLLIDFIEERFGIKPSDKDLVEDNFKSIDAIAKYIQSKEQGNT